MARGWIYPVVVWLGLLALIFATEYAVMLVLPWLLPEQPPLLLEAGIDAMVLTAGLAPVLWWTLVRPLREVIRLRTQFLADLFAQIENDRRRTAMELHDGVGQGLTLLISGLRSTKICRATVECAGRVDDFQQLAENALTEVRRLALGLRPSLLDDLGLAPGLERLVEDVRAHQPFEITLNVADVISSSPPEPIATTVFRVIQEALTNVIKHARARHVTVTIRLAQGNVIVEVSDDGVGIPPSQLHALPPGHLGLRGMRERAGLLGGNLRIDSTPGNGTRLTITIPVKGRPLGQSTPDAGGRP